VSLLVFDCDGVLADTERDGHLPAFNQTFREFGLPVQWSDEEYAEKLRIGGGKERLATILTPELVHQAGLPQDAEARQAAIGRWHRRKTEIFVGLVEAGALPPRAGIGRLAAEADAAGWRLAVCSTSHEASVSAILRSAVGAALASRFVVLAGDIVERKKPAPDIYLLVLERLGTSADEAIVVEDSWNGLRAATAAGITTIVTPSAYTLDEDFGDAALVISSLGDPGGEPLRVIANRSRATPDAYLTVADLEACLRR
jgi:HAD superfamily hydrolase (TIGR01509 family)